jgi:molecular chaperone GrpE
VIEQTLDRFRQYLRELHAPVDSPANAPPPFDWATLAGQFTALRHDVNLQTKAVRSAGEQTAEVLRAIPKASEPAPVQPWLKTILDIADNLALALKQVERSTESLQPLVEQLAVEAPVDTVRPGFFARLFGGQTNKAEPSAAHTELVSKLEPMLGGIAEGYTMSLHRVQKLLEQLGLQPIEATGKTFDPELMEVIEVAVGTNRPAGTVVEEFRKGYRHEGKVFRFAQVKVAR